MSRFEVRIKPIPCVKDFAEFVTFLRYYFRRRGYQGFARFEKIKDRIVDLLYKKRGKYARPFLHFGTIGLIFLVIIFGPIVLQQAEQEDGASSPISKGILSSASAFNQTFSTLQSEEVRQYRGGEIITHVVQEGETLSSIAERYNLEVSTLLWENSLSEKEKIKPGQKIDVLPVDGIRHKVKRGETIYSVGKKYGLEESAAQAIVDYPFNEFMNDETFELATGQYIIVPGGIKKDAPAPVKRPSIASSLTPDAGAVSATGNFVWPATGRITQGYKFYHKAIDIANRAAGPILAADSGTVVEARWDASGYGNKVVVDHGNGYLTLYAHLRVIQVQPGQRVSRGNVLGQMGSTGRSTGTHLHFEIRRGGVLLNPLSFLQ